MNFIKILSTRLSDITKYNGELSKQKSWENSSVSLIGNYTFNKVSFRIVFYVDKKFPFSLPRYYIENYLDMSNMLPHIEKNGFVCYTESNNILLDYSRPEEIVAESLKRALNLIEIGIKKLNKEDLRTEFLSYWMLLDGCIPADSFIKVDNLIRTINYTFLSDHFIFYDTNDSNEVAMIKAIYNNEITKNQRFPALYVPLRKNQIFPFNFKKKLSISWIRDVIFHNISSSSKHYLNNYFKRVNFRQSIVLVSIPVSESNIALIGFGFKRKTAIPHYKNTAHPLKTNMSNFIVEPISLKRYDQDFLIERTSRETLYRDQCVAIVGLGSVGSKVAMEVSRLGVKRIKMIDDDFLDIDNIYRHEAGASTLFKSGSSQLKIDVLEEKILRDFPDADIECEGINVLNIFNERPDYFDDCDCVIVCVGDTMTSLKLNQIFKKRNITCIYGWLDPYGIGGHLLVINPFLRGCYQCLYTSTDGELVNNRASFAEKGQSFTRSLASCTSRYIPYGSLTILKETAYIIENLIEVLKKNINKNYLVSWTGDTTLFRRDGYRLSKRYFTFGNEGVKKELDFYAQKCEACGEE